MSRGKKTKYTRREEQQAQKVVKILFVSLIVLGLILIVAFSLLS